MKKNLQILQEIRQQSGCKILLAQKAFSMYSCYPLIGEYLDGTTASGLYEAKLGKECMGKENHIFSPAYREDEFEEVLESCEHLVFNSFSQLERFGERHYIFIQHLLQAPPHTPVMQRLRGALSADNILYESPADSRKLHPGH